MAGMLTESDVQRLMESPSRDVRAETAEKLDVAFDVGKLTDKELEQILEDFEEHATPLPIGEKSEIIERKAEQVRKRKAATAPRKASTGRKPAARQRKAS